MTGPTVLASSPGVAIVGTGFIGPVHAEALRRLGIPVVGLLGSTPDRARPVAERLGIGRVYDGIDDLLTDPSVGSVHVTSPNAAHFAQSRAVLESGRHLLCEKPLALSTDEGRRLMALAASRPSQRAGVNYNIRYYAHCREMRARVARGDLGRVLAVTGSYTQDWLLKPTDYNWRVESDDASGLRAVSDIGTHWMDLAQHVTGLAIGSVLADLTTCHPTRFRPTGETTTFSDHAGASTPIAVRTEDFASVLLRFEGEARGSFHVSQVSAGRKNRLVIEVAGTEGMLAWDSESPDHLWLGRRDGPNGGLPRDPSLLTPEAAAGTDYPGGHVEGFPDSFKHLFRDFYHGGTSYPSLADGARELALCEAIAWSAREGRWADIAEVG